MPERMKTPEQELASKSRRSFLALGIAAVAGGAGWSWLRSRMNEDGIPGPFRSVFEVNKAVTEKVLFSDGHLAPEYPADRRQKIRANGSIGLEDDIDVDAWRLQLQLLGDSQPAKHLTMRDLRQLPKVEYTVEFKCVEGWSTISQWGGVRLRDFIDRFASSSRRAQYVSMATPDESYYVGLDMPSALHPQTLLAYELNGARLTSEHGAPLRLVIPVKYGIKNLKRIGSIQFTDDRPDDYWAERGYDYHAAL